MKKYMHPQLVLPTKIMIEPEGSTESLDDISDDNLFNPYATSHALMVRFLVDNLHSYFVNELHWYRCDGTTIRSSLGLALLEETCCCNMNGSSVNLVKILFPFSTLSKPFN